MSEGLVEGLVSVVIPAYNGERFLRAAIESVLRQEGVSLEVIVIDDGSTDGSGDVARSFGPPVVCLRQENGGLGAARNAGVLAARGQYLASLDADDLWTEGKLAIQIERLLSEPGLDCVFGLVEHFEEEDVAGRFEVNVGRTASGLSAGTMLIRRQAFLRVGLFSSDRRMGEFIDWFARAQDAGLRHEVMQQVMLRRRVHGDNITLKAPHGADYLHVLKAALDRRRSAP
ncbi:MAG: glycosyltransferase [Dehalococcoidia bacterium]|nr:glycosyltransferase [Dehalococcoidia bacterium]